MSRVDEQVRALASSTPNFGYLLDHEPTLVVWAAGAESYVFTDPNTSMFKARQFGEALTAALFLHLGLPGMPSSQYQRLNVLGDQGAVTTPVRSQFDRVRLTGNKAVHQGYAAQRDALQLVRTCYELGAWFHRMVTGRSDVPAFVPPQPAQQPPPGPADLDAFDELHGLLREYHAELAEMRLVVDQQTELAAAEAAASRAADQAILEAVNGRDGLRALVEQLAGQVSQLQDQLTRSAAAAAPIDPARRDEMISRSATASRPPLSEKQVRRIIDRMLTDAGWTVQDRDEVGTTTPGGVALREVTVGQGRADYLLHVDGTLVGVVEAKREGLGLGGVDRQSQRYAEGLTGSHRLAAWRAPLPYRYESTGVQTQFTNAMDPNPRPRPVFSFHQPATIARWMREAEANPDAPTLRARFQHMPPLHTEELRTAQVEAITGLEESLAHDRPRALIQMATGAGKTIAVVNETYRLLKFAGAKRVLFLVDRNTLGRQADTAFRNFVAPDDGTRFTSSYNVQRLSSAVVQDSSHVVISTVQRMFAVLRGTELPAEDDESADRYETDDVVELAYNAAIPPETFDLVVVDECHRSIYGRWRAVLEYFDAHLVGLTATPVAQTFGFFRENLVSEYSYRRAVVDGVNVDYQIMRIRTEVGEHGGSIPADQPVRVVDLHTRRERYEQLDTVLDYDADEIGRSVMNPSQIRTAVQTFAERWPEYFPKRRLVPKTLIFAKNDKHADDIVEIVRDVFDGDARFCAKITYRSDNPERLISEFRNDAAFRIAVTVDMIATGTDVRPLEGVFFLRGVSSPTYFEQMKGRGARTIDDDEFKAVTPDAPAKDKFLLIDAVGVTDSPLVDARPLQPATQRQVSLENLLNRAANQTITTEEAAALGSRLTALHPRLTPVERQELTDLAGGRTLPDIAGELERATDEDVQEGALRAGGQQAQRQLVLEAVRPLADSKDLRDLILSMRRKYDLLYDEYTRDSLISVETRTMDEDTSRTVVEAWRAYIDEHRDEITALRIAFEDPGRDPREVYAAMQRLARTIADPPHRWTPDLLWQAYRQLGIAKDNGRTKGVPELIKILRYELNLDPDLRSYHSTIEERLRNWIARQEQTGVRFTGDQVWWIERIAHALANRLSVTEDDLDGPPFTEHGGVGGFLHAFGPNAEQLLDDLNKDLPA